MRSERALFRLKKYLSFRRRSQSSFALHSPFLYELYNAMRARNFLNKQAEDELKNLRKVFASDKTSIEFEDPGARGGTIKSTVAEIFKRTSKPIHQAACISAAASYINAKKILELGTAFGTTSLCMHFFNPEASICTMEGVSAIADKAEMSLAIAKEGSIESKTGLFKDLLPDYIKENQNIDFVFMDGHHSGAASTDYLNQIYPALSDIAIIAVDDIYYSSDMEDFWNSMITDNRFEAGLDFFHFGLLIKNSNLQKMNFTLKI